MFEITHKLHVQDFVYSEALSDWFAFWACVEYPLAFEPQREDM